MAPSKPVQTLLLSDEAKAQQYTDMKERGYWLSTSFFPGCYKRVATVPQRKLKVAKGIVTDTVLQEYKMTFRGLIATGRVVRCETDGEETVGDGHAAAITFLCIGYDNGKYLDVVVQGAKGGLLAYAAVEGTAIVRDPEMEEGVEVKTIRGVSLRSLVE